MGEVMLAMELHRADPAQRAAFDEAMIKRRWDPVAGMPATYCCYFENGFIDEVRRIVNEDVTKSARHAKIAGWRGAHSWSAIEHVVLSSHEPDSQAEPSEASAAEIWTDRGTGPVGPIADVMLTARFASSDPIRELRFRGALSRRGWRSLDGLQTTFRHAFDLGMFESIGDRVSGDVRAAIRHAGIVEWRAAWSQSTFECTLFAAPVPRKKIRSLPWDPEP